MTNSILTNAVAVNNGKATTTSLKIAEVFGKRHDNVIRDIQSLQVPDNWCALNFEETSIEVKQPNGGTRPIPAYQITRDGFTILAMGFTGAKAMQFKLAYIEAFNRMEEELRNPAAALPPANQAAALSALTWYDYRGFKVTTSLELYRFNHTGQTFRQFSKTFSVWCRRNLKTDVDIFRSRSKANGSRLSLITESGAAKAIDYIRRREAEPGCTLTPISGVAPVAHIDLYRRPEQPAKDENSEMRGLHFTKLPYLSNQFKLSQLLEKCRDFGMDVNAETREFLLLFGAMHAIRLTATRGCVMSDGKGGFEYDIL